jgi:hypothetical protein
MSQDLQGIDLAVAPNDFISVEFVIFSYQQWNRETNALRPIVRRKPQSIVSIQRHPPSSN